MLSWSSGVTPASLWHHIVTVTPRVSLHVVLAVESELSLGLKFDIDIGVTRVDRA